MDLKVKYEQLWDLILQLPAAQLSKLKKDLDKLSKKKHPASGPNDFQEFLLHGPVMTEEQFELFQENRKFVKEWIKR